MQMSNPPINPTLEVVGAVTAPCNAPILAGAINAISTNGADNKKNSHSELIATPRTPSPRPSPPSPRDGPGQTTESAASSTPQKASDKSPYRKYSPPATATLP